MAVFDCRDLALPKRRALQYRGSTSALTKAADVLLRQIQLRAIRRHKLNIRFIHIDELRWEDLEALLEAVARLTVKGLRKDLLDAQVLTAKEIPVLSTGH